jgi:replicative DNA helicase
MRSSELLDQASEQLVTLREITAQPDAAEGNADTIARIIERGEAHLRGDETGAMPLGITDLDNRLGGGLRAGRLVILAGRPGAGKTAVELALAARLAAKGVGVGIFSLEIDRDENVARLMASMLARANGAAQPEYSAITTGRMTESEIESLVTLKPSFARLPIELDCSASLTMSQVEARAKRMALKLERRGQKLGVVFVDYLQLLKMQDRYKGNQVAEYGEAVLHAKNMAKRLGVAVVLLSQLNRGVESREDKRPNMGDLRGSGNIEEHADVVGLLYRPAYYNFKDPKVITGADPAAYDLAMARRNDLHVIFDKNRLGPPGETLLYIDVARCFVDSKARGL